MTIKFSELDCLVSGIVGLKYIHVTNLTFKGHVTSLVTWKFNSPYTISCRCSVGTDTLAPTD